LYTPFKYVFKGKLLSSKSGVGYFSALSPESPLKGKSCCPRVCPCYGGRNHRIVVLERYWAAFNRLFLAAATAWPWCRGAERELPSRARSGSCCHAACCCLRRLVQGGRGSV